MSLLGESTSESLSKICRLCAAESDDAVEVFSDKGFELCLVEKIAKCLPIVVRAEDELTNYVCTLCQKKLDDCRQFFEDIYNTTVKLLKEYREIKNEDLSLSFDEHLHQFVRCYPDTELVTAKQEVDDFEYTNTIFTEMEGNGFPQIFADTLDEKVDVKKTRRRTKQVDTIKSEPMYHVDLKQDFDNPLEDVKANFDDDNADMKEDFDELSDFYLTPKKKGKGRPPGKKKAGISKRKIERITSPLRKCTECGATFGGYEATIVHWTQNHPGKKIVFKCTWDNCDHLTSNVIDVKKHRRNHMIEAKILEKCDICSKYFASWYLHYRHKIVHQDDRNFGCTECDKVFKTKDHLKKHEKTHNSKEEKYTHTCEICGRKFTQKANLDAHIRTHTGVRPFKCDFCEKSFSQKGNLDEHRRTHTGEKPYVCDICGSRHTRRGELKLHVRCAHTQERPFACSYCSKSFQRRDLLRKHERSHTNTRPYGCEFCGKTFTARDKMIVHRRLHTGERPYVCKFCGRGFCESGNMKKHMRVHENNSGQSKGKHMNNKLDHLIQNLAPQQQQQVGVGEPTECKEENIEEDQQVGESHS